MQTFGLLDTSCLVLISYNRSLNQTGENRQNWGTLPWDHTRKAGPLAILVSDTDLSMPQAH